ncbi:uncharacterized protein LOC108954433 [Eucalyptus grandis]|uniref:uncharacterized protein LOC108954433 n=1 Tax=Eucalyptus grandis TaxID=71139 RepID=UPI00192E7684|nr:uncharacterized protein LOC108954433 [Eucalyptus grandis]
MAGNNSFMTDLLALLDNEDNLMKVVTSEPSSSTAPFDVKYYLTIIEEILDHATAVAENTQPKGNHVQSKSLTLPSKEISSTNTELCCQITCRAQHTNNVGKTLASIFDQLSSFPWGARAVLTLLALTMHYAEKWRLTQIEESDELLRLMARLRGLHTTGKSSDTQRSKAFLEISNLIRVTLEFTRFQGRDLSTLSVRVTRKQESFKKQVEVFVQKNGEIIDRRNFYTRRSENFTVLMLTLPSFWALLFCNGKDSPTVTQGFKKTPAEVEQLQNKKVMLLISDLTLSDNEIMWVPIADVKDDERFQKKRSKMPLYSCNSIVSKAAARFIKKYWQFKQQTKHRVLLFLPQASHHLAPWSWAITVRKPPSTAEEPHHPSASRQPAVLAKSKTTSAETHFCRVPQ